MYARWAVLPLGWAAAVIVGFVSQNAFSTFFVGMLAFQFWYVVNALVKPL
jgi:hypothetical protein